MSGSRVVFDGLWRCLCPSVDANVATRLLSSPALPRPSPAARHRLPTQLPVRHHALRPQCRRYSSAPSASIDSNNGQEKWGMSTPPPVEEVAAGSPHSSSQPEAGPDLSEHLHSASLSAVYEALGVLRGQPKSFKKVATIITHLVTARNAELDVTLYEHLVAAMADVDGSAAMLAQLFAEMKALDLKPSSYICHAALAALAVHHDYLIRNEVLGAMKQSWTEVSHEGESHVALGLLRDGQYELALDKLESLIDSHAHIEPWIFDIFTFVFAQKGFVEEAVKLAHTKVHLSNSDTHLAVWYMLLDVCSQAYHYEGTRYIWGRMLETDRQHLSDGVLLNIVNTAARQHDYEIVASANSLIVSRGGKLLAHHYEPLIECYGGIGDIVGALRVLCIMFNAISVAPYASTRPIYECIKKQPESLEVALEALPGLMGEYKVPIAILNVLVEASVETHGFAKALNIYQNAHNYTEAPPNHVTIRYLLQTCEDKKALKDLVAEDPERAMKGDRGAFIEAIFEMVMSNELDLAYKCVDLLGDAPEPGIGGRPQPWIPRQTLLALIRKSLDVQDERVWALVDQAKKRNMDVQTGIAKLMASFAEEVKRTTGLGQETEGLEGGSEPRHPSTL
ncbi:pentatricopeptide repeat domain-containing protein [Colletotrichum plurivorum]|uniref:Pentatricopeptide repeat domain-containing protein n=1 Tax=Colletotrichum plurivorum TaxID=2175906 RepID=A0A8H6MWU1_9PEZI|nr:pentatricopeptide repeat domain-containing protein [Colletotrichum plurivorum]